MTDLSSSEGVVLDNSEPNDQSEEPFVNNADKGDKSQEKSPDLQQDSDVAQGKETDDLKMNQDDCEDLVLRARGLPWSATAEDVEKFFSGCEIKGGAENGIHFTFSRDGRPSGECFIEFASMEDCQKALLKNNEHMGKRYVEVFESKRSEMEWVCKRMGVASKEKDTETVVRLRGLPYGCSKEEVANFFKGLEIAPNGITIAHDEDGKNTGDAFVEFASPEIASQAMNKHKEKIGHRYIEIFRSSRQEAKAALLPKPKPLMSARPGPYDRRGGFAIPGRFGGQPSGFERRYRGGRGGFGGPGNDFGGFGGPSRGGGRGGRSGFGGGGGGGGYGGSYGGGGGGGGGGFGRDSGGLSKSTTGHCIHMRGLPFSATEADVKQWFMPLNPVAIRMEFETSGSGARRSRGEADVDFASDADAKAAMAKDRQMMGHRYIELFLRSEYDGDDDWNGEQSFYSGNGMNFSGGGGFGNSFGNSGGGGGGGGSNYGGGGGGGGGGNYGGGSGGGNFGGGNSSFSGGNSSFGGGGGGSSNSGNYGGGYGGGSGQGGNYGNQGNNMGSSSSFFSMQGSGQGGGGGMMGSSGGAGYGNQGVGSGALQSGGGSSQSSYQQGSGFNQASQGQGGNFSSTSAGAFNSAAIYGQDSKTGMVSYPTY